MILREDSPLGIALFGLDRTIPGWVQCQFQKGPVLDLGPGNKEIPGAVRLDWPAWNAEAPHSLDDYADDSVGGIFAINLLEHLSDPRLLIREMGRVLIPGCPANIFVPNARSNMYLQDLDHKTPFVIDTFKNFLEPHPYYEKDHEKVPLRVGAAFSFAVKDENLATVAQLIKEES